MVIYHNDFDKEKDPMMWELHQIRNELHKDMLSPDKINEKGKNVLLNWNKNRKQKISK